MTRMEKYADYRREILEMKGDIENTKKHQTSKKVNELLKKEDTLALEDVLSGLDIYQNDNVEKSKCLNVRQKRYLKFILICSAIIAILLVATIVVGIKVFGGK